MNTTEKLLKPKITYADTLRFTAYAYAKLLYFRDKGPTEVAGFCITGTDDPLLITDFRLIKQKCTGGSFDLDKDDIAQYQESTLDAGLAAWQSLRILAHSHPPGCSPSPSEPDEENFRNVFTKPNWAIMLIIADGGKAYCRLKINIGPGVEKLLKVEVDFSQNFAASDHEMWDTEYAGKVTEEKFRMTGKEGVMSYPNTDDPMWCREYDKWSETDLDDLDCQWDENGNVWYYDDDDDEGKWYVYSPINQKWYVHNIDEDTDNVVEIKTPKELWTGSVILWAKNHMDECPATAHLLESRKVD